MSATALGRPLSVLHIPFTYFPDAVGGTEVYVADLTSALRGLGIDGAVAAPDCVDREYLHDGVRVFRFAVDSRQSLAQAYGAPDDKAARSFGHIVARLQPDVVHLHARTAAVSARLADVSRGYGAKVVFTYHTPTASCPRGTLLWMGQEPCDGALDVGRCTKCTLQSHGLRQAVRDAVAAIPICVANALGAVPVLGRAGTALRMPSLIDEQHRQFRAILGKADRIVAVSLWVADLLRVNGIADARLTICRHGVGSPRVRSPRGVETRRGGTLLIGCFGRLDSTKGMDLLAEALRRVPGEGVRVDVYGVSSNSVTAYHTTLHRAAERDARFRLLPALAPEHVAETMARYDVVAVPSRWLETGPLVVLEAFAAGTPVLGARLGGIAELVTHGVDGILVEPDDPRAWARAIEDLARSPDTLAGLRAGIRSPRTMDDVAKEMKTLYESLVSAAD